MWKHSSSVILTHVGHRTPAGSHTCLPDSLPLLWSESDWAGRWVINYTLICLKLA